jgi:hypothetical protein
VAAFAFSNFRRTQVVFEIKFENEHLLWDRAGALWDAIGTQFRKLKHTTVNPNEQMFFGDDRFTMIVSLERASITDNRPHGSLESTFDLFSTFATRVIKMLEVKVLTRVGNRYFYTIECKSMEDARRKAEAAIPNAVPKKTLFSMEPPNITPAFKLDANDGELAYIVQLYHREVKIEFSPPPEAMALGMEKTEKQAYQLVFDADFFTTAPIATESFDARTWLQGWNKAVTRDADTFLSLAEGRQ